MTAQIKITACEAELSDTTDALDVVVSLRGTDDAGAINLDCSALGAVTLLRDQHGEWSMWGDRDHWCGGELLSAVDEAEVREIADSRELLARIERAAADACDDFVETERERADVELLAAHG